MDKTILLTGANGQLGKSIHHIAEKSPSSLYNIIYSDIDEIDITQASVVRDAVKETGAKMIINCAAYTAVDQAEDDVETAFLINEKAVANLAKTAKESGCFLIHISTDYVFDGTATLPYPPDAPLNPVSIYGKSKAAGEKAIFDSGCYAAIIRTSWLYSAYGHNFVKSIIHHARNKKELNVVNDQYGSPTYAPDLAGAILQLINTPSLHHQVNLYHYADEGVITWYDFATEIVKLWNIDCKVNPIESSQYPTKAKRPAYSVFDLSKIKNDLGISIPEWKESLKSLRDSGAIL